MARFLSTLSLLFALPLASLAADPLVPLGEQLFFEETFDGNGRTCATCHDPGESFGGTPQGIASLFAADPLAVGLFLGTSVHETAQVAGAGLVYQQYYNDPQVLDVATVTKLVRNLGMLVIIPLMCIVYHRDAKEGGAVPKWWTMVPLFVIGFALMSLITTIGDSGELAFGFLAPEQWSNAVDSIKKSAEICLAIAMASVGLGTSIRGLISIGLKPLAMGLVAALLVGGVSATLITLLY